MTSDLTTLTLAEARDGLRAKKFSSTEMTRAFLAAIEKANPQLNAYVLETPEQALAMAQIADNHLGRGDARPLEGLPLGIKDLFCTKGVRTTACSKVLGDFKPTYESTVTANLWSAGAVMLGKLNNDEFAMGSSNETSCFGSVVNPWRRKRAAGSIDTAKLVPGGSSGGSSASVAANLCLAATATDTGGSIRQPASFCGLAGLKTSYGRVSRYGLIAFGSSLDTIGPLARSVADAALIFSAIAGHDPRDATSMPLPVPPLALDGADVKGLRVGVPQEYFISGMQAEVESAVRTAIATLAGLGAELVEISLPHTEYALPVYYLVAPAEASANLARFDGVRYGLRVSGAGEAGLTSLWDQYEATRGAGFGPEVKRRIMLGAYALSAGYYDAYYGQAQKVRTLIKRDFDQAFERVDVIACPVAPTTAFALGSKTDDPLAMYLEDVFTLPPSLAGICGLSVPCGFDTAGLPIGLQLLGPAFGEDRVLRAGHVYQQATAWHTRRPPL